MNIYFHSRGYFMKYTFKQKFRYRFDNMMSKGTVSMIKMLAIATLAVVVILTAAVFITTDPEERSLAGSFWDILATAINAWMPYSDEGNAGYIIFTAVAAVAGLLFTSVLIGIIGSAIEDKLTELRNGKSVVLESGHKVILGFTPGAYTLINQLIAAAEDNFCCILVASHQDKSEIEDDIRDNVDIPKNV